MKNYNEEKWISHELSLENRTQGLPICNNILNKNVKLSFLHHILQCDEKWVLHINRKQNSGYEKMRNQY